MRSRGVVSIYLWLTAFLWTAMGAGVCAQESAPAKPLSSKAAPGKAVKFGKLWDGKGKVWTNAIVILEGERIREVTTDEKKIPAGATVLDLSKYYGLPGLIDVHTHMTIYTDETPGIPMTKQLTTNSPAV